MKKFDEITIISEMILMFCKKKHGKSALCADCTTLLDYAKLRINKCPFSVDKTFCSACKVHCYNTEMREKIRQVMRFSGPRMIFCHPILSIRHAVLPFHKRKG